METFSALLALCAANSPVTGEFPSPRTVTRSLDIFFGLRLNKRLSNGETGDLRRHRAHYVLWHINARNACYCTESTCSLAAILTIGAWHPNPLHRRHNGRNSVSNHQLHNCLHNRLFRRRSKKTPKLRVTGLCVGNSPGTGEFPAQMASNAESLSIWWRHHAPMFHRVIEWWLKECHF